MDLIKIENELKKRLSYPYIWGTRQNDNYDKQTNFIYHISEFEPLLAEIEKQFNGTPEYKQLFNYALNRWYNFWSAQAVEQIFCECKGVIPDLDYRNKLIDFSINGINFDHKTSVFPNGYGESIDYAIANKKSIIEWLYKNQSQQQRHHLKNRLFIIVYSKNSEHWKMKSEITELSKIIHKYIDNFSEGKLLKFTFADDSDTLSDIIWFIK